MNNTNISLNCRGGVKAPKLNRVKVLISVFFSLIVIILMGLSSRYSPFCDDFLVSFKFTPHYDSSTKISVAPSLDSSTNTFRRTFGTVCPVLTRKEITSELNCVMKIPKKSVIDGIEILFSDTNGLFEISSIQLGDKKIPLDSIIDEDSDIKIGKGLNLISGNIKETANFEVNNSGEKANIVINKSLAMTGTPSIRFGNILSILTIAIISYFICCQFIKFIVERHKSDETKVVVHYKSRQFMNIEILRFLLVMFVIMEHSATPFLNISPDDFSYLDNFVNVGRSQLFFTIAGFFLFFSSKNLQSDPIFFIKKRWLRLSGLVIFSTLVCFAIHNYHTAYYPIEDNLLTGLLINLLKSETRQYFVHPAWYVNVLFFLSCIFFVIFKTLEKKHALLFTVLLASLSLNLYARGIHLGLDGWINMPGAIFSLSIGILMAEAFKRISLNTPEKEVTKKNIPYFAYSCFEIFIFVSLLIGLYGKHLGFNLGNNVMSGSIALMLWLFLIKKGMLSNFFNKTWAIYFGKYTYSIFVTHVIIVLLASSLMKTHHDFCIQHNIAVPVAVIITILIFAVFCHHFVEIPLSRWTAEKFLYSDKAKS